MWQQRVFLMENPSFQSKQMERNPRTDPEVSLFYKHSDHVQGRTWRTAGGSRWFNLRGNSSIYFKYGTRAVPVARFEFCSLILITQGDVILSRRSNDRFYGFWFQRIRQIRVSSPSKRSISCSAPSSCSDQTQGGGGHGDVASLKLSGCGRCCM